MASSSTCLLGANEGEHWSPTVVIWDAFDGVKLVCEITKPGVVTTRLNIVTANVFVPDGGGLTSAPDGGAPIRIFELRVEQCIVRRARADARGVWGV